MIKKSLAPVVVNPPALLHTCQFLIQPLMFERELLVFEAGQVDDGGLEIVNVAGILDDVIREIVGLAVDGAGAGAPAA